jgi:hypothetical protein
MIPFREVTIDGKGTAVFMAVPDCMLKDRDDTITECIVFNTMGVSIRSRSDHCIKKNSTCGVKP